MSKEEKVKRPASKVSRSVFVKCDEKRKTLLREIYILTSIKYIGTKEKVAVMDKYRKIQEQDRWLSDFLKEVKKTLKPHTNVK